MVARVVSGGVGYERTLLLGLHLRSGGSILTSLGLRLLGSGGRSIPSCSDETKVSELLQEDDLFFFGSKGTTYWEFGRQNSEPSWKMIDIAEGISKAPIAPRIAE